LPVPTPFTEPAPPQGQVAVTTGEGRSAAIKDEGGRVTLAGADTSAKDPSIALAQQIIDLARKSDKENRAAIEDFAGKSIPELEASIAEANKGDKRALLDLQGVLGDMGIMDPSQYVGDAASSPEDIARQEQAYAGQQTAADKFLSLSDPSLTAKERFMFDQARREQEQDRRSATQAALSELGMRGARSGGADIAAHLDASQATAQNRAMMDLGALASAQDRSMQALQGFGNTTAQMSSAAQGMRDSSDKMSTFNQQQKQLWSMFTDKFKADQQEQAADRAKTGFDAATYTSGQEYGRGKDLYSANRDVAAMKTGQFDAGAARITDALRGKIGITEANKATASLEEEDESVVGKILKYANPYTAIDEILGGL
jgi:hypothetical protein